MRRYTILCEDSHCESIFLEVTLFSSSFFLYICFRPCHSFHMYRFLCEYIHTTCITGMLRYSLFILNMRRKILRLHPLCHSTLNRKKMRKMKRMKCLMAVLHILTYLEILYHSGCCIHGQYFLLLLKLYEIFRILLSSQCVCSSHLTWN